MVEMRGFTSMTCSPTSWMLKKWSRASSATIFSAVSTSPASSSVSKYIASPARIASRVLAWPRTTRPPSAMPSNAERVQHRGGVRFVVGTPDCRGRSHHHRDVAEALLRVGQRLEVERGLGENGVHALLLADFEHGVREVGSRSRGDEVEGVAE